MRRKHMIAAGAIAVAGLIIPSVTCTPVLAETGTAMTKEEMQDQNDKALKEAFADVNLGNSNIAYGVLSTVATPTGAVYNANQNRYYYSVTADFPLEYRMYFNKNKNESGTEEHSLREGFNIFRIYPNGTGPVEYDDPDYASKIGTDDVGEWPFPQMDGVQTMSNARVLNKMNTVFTRNAIASVLYGLGERDLQGGFNNKGLVDVKKGVLAWEEDVELGDYGEEYFSHYETDDNGKTYHTSNLQISGIVGRPGDKLEVKVCQSYSESIYGWVFSTYPVATDPTSGYNPALVSDGHPDGTKVVTGYIYIPYQLTFNKNGAEGDAPTTDGKYLTCDHRTLQDLPGQGNMVKDGRDDVELLGWTETPVQDVITRAEDIPDNMYKPTESYTIEEGTRENVTLYAVWGVKGIVDAGLGDFANGISLLEWVIAGGIAGGIATGIAVRSRMKRRHQQ